MPRDYGKGEDEAILYGTTEGTEGEEDLDRQSLGRLSEAVVSAADWTTETILLQLERGNIDLKVHFQRRDAWRPSRKSKFIESLILGLPIPQLVLAENKRKKGSYLVIDGKQRLLSLRQFAASADDEDFPQLKLEGLEVHRDLIGKSLKDLEADTSFAEELRLFQNQTIRTVVIKAWPDESALYLIFLRLNTGSVQLSPQELRQALLPGKFVDFADVRSGQIEGFHRIFKSSDPDFRMRDAELLVRYYAFKNFLEEYRGNLKDFLDLTCQRLNSEWEQRKDEIEKQAQDLAEALEATFEIFGEDDAFRKWDGKQYEGRFNRAVFDAMIFYLSDAKVRTRALARKSHVARDFQNLCSRSRAFLRSVETTTKSVDSTSTRLTLWGESLKRRLKLTMAVPVQKSNRIQIQ
jgi:hypothetical protein